MKVTYNITQNKFNANLNQETTEIKVKFQTGYYPLPGGGGGDLSNYYTKDETYSKTEVDDIIADIPVVDTSNLVPYTGANKDVNIASNYFKTSKGFDFTYDNDNYFRAIKIDNNYYLLEFKSKDESEDNFGSIELTVTPDSGFEIIKKDNNGLALNNLQVNNFDIRSLKPFVSKSGFKVYNGTPNKALTADGGTFDLNTKADLEGGKVPATQLPSYVDDVLEYANLASFPATGESGKIYIAIDTNLTYRWGGSNYVVMSSSLALGETSSTAYRGDRGKIAYDHSQTTGNPHYTTKNDIGLGNVPNLDTTNAVNNSHTHSNKSILDLITEPFTTSLKSLYDGVVTSINNLLLTGQRLITSGEITKLSNTSGTNTGDETTSSIQTKRPLKTIEGQSLEGSGNIDLTKNDIGLGNVPNIDATNPTNIVQTSSYRFVTDSEKTNLSTAYTHSQATGNPHNTKLEELTDLGSETTTIADTDIILKKESGGLWRKITFANFKNWFTTALAKKINIGLDTIFNFKNISAMTLTEFRSITPDIETIYFTEEQNGTGWQQVRYNGLGITIPATTETLISLTNENFIELDSDSTFNLIDVANTKINGIFEKDFVIIKFNAGVVTPATANQWFKVILKVNNVQTAVSPVFYLTETSGTVEQIAHNFALNVPTEMVTNGATLHLKTSAAMTFNNPAISVVRVHKSTNANL